MEVIPFHSLPASLILLSSHLSASEKNPTTKNGRRTNFNLKLNHPLLAQLESCTTMRHLKQFHARMITTGLVHDTFAASRLLAFCAFSVHGDLHYALALFHRIENPNLFVWNAMIRAFSRSNRPEFCIRLYVEMLRFGCIPDSYTFPFLVKACSHLFAVSEGRQVHAHVVKTGLWSDDFVTNSLIHMYGEFGWIRTAEKMFENMPVRNEVASATIIAGFVRNDRVADAVALFCSKEWRELEVDRITLATVLSACAKVRDLKLGEEIHQYIRERDFEMGMILGNSLMNMYAKCGCIETAQSVFDNMPETDLISWNVLISGYLENGYLERSLEMVSVMKGRNIRADEGIFLSLISACEQLDLGILIHNLIKEMGVESSLSICSALIDMYSRIGFVEIGREVFDEMPQRDIVTWNSMVAGYARPGLMQMACALFDQMPERDNCSWSTMILGYVKQGMPNKAMEVYKKLLIEGRIEPDKITILSALTACSHLGALEEGESVHHYMESCEMQIDAALGTALIDMYAKCGCLEKAVQVFEGLLNRNVLVWTALISGLATHGHGKEALLVFKQMQSSGGGSVKPNSITFLSVLSACAHAGLVEDGWKIYDSMVLDYGIEPEMQHVGCMVDLLGRAGLLKEALEFIAGLRFDVDARVWGALLGASKVHGNTELGEVAARKMLELEPTHDGAHVLMSNIYVEAGRWTESENLRRKMKADDITKVVGRSWIEVNGVRHEFTAGNMFLSEEMWKELHTLIA